ncbi:hypothetical protein [Bacillus cihuensis]|uniref:hypothetical protein n=1 Tax=Bacillus cihuensis TaxID=1208599 RepID=UPI00040F810D|nr:hypothetical protein [Bacillus cihuensis]
MNREQESEIFLDWLFNKEEKIKPFNLIINHLKEVYLSDKERLDSISFVKDSALVI